MLIVLGALAKFERDLICTRTGEGRARARVNGMKMGRKPRLSPYLQCEAIRRRDRGQEILAVIGRSYKCQRMDAFEAQIMNAVHLARIDPARNMCRFYRLDAQPDLFRDFAVVK